MKTDITEHKDAVTGERYLSFRHKSGVKVLICPNTYSTSCAVYTSDFGGADTDFEYGGKKYGVPLGTAHFLEHKLFETEDSGDAFKLFSELGADSNAFTSHQATSYTFTSSNDAFYESLKILLDFVHKPHFTEASVSKERGIIEEEIKMYEDSPDNKSYYELMRCLYKNRGVRYDVGGTSDTIKLITPEVLYFCHKVFYSPSNMVLIAAGDVDAEKIIAVMDGTVPCIKRSKTIKRIRQPEPDKAYKRSSRLYMDVSEPLFSFGIKDPDIENKALMRRKSVALSILSNLLFGESSAFYCDLYEKGLLSGDIDAGYYYGDDHAYFSVLGESRKPYTVKKRIYETLDKAVAEGVDDASFELAKKIFYANYVYSMQNSQAVAYSLLSFYQSGDDMLKYPRLLSGIHAPFAVSCLKELYKKERSAYAVVLPIQ